MWCSSERSRSREASPWTCPSRSVVGGSAASREAVLSRQGLPCSEGGLVSTGSGDEERAWAADKRDFVADRRDEVADERDRVADTRDRTADDREAELTSGNSSWTPAPRSLAVPLRSLERLHSGPRPVPDGRRRDRTETRRGGTDDSSCRSG